MKASLFERTNIFLKRLLTENLRLKSLAMVITILVFLLVRGGNESTDRFTVDVEFVHPEKTADRILINHDLPETLRIRVRGSARVVKLVSDEDIPPIILDLKHEPNGDFVIDSTILKLPYPGLEVISVRPSLIKLQYEKRVQREIKIHPILSGRAARGNHVVDPVVTVPTKITITGPEATIREIQEIQTKLIDIDGLGPGSHVRKVDLTRSPQFCDYIGSKTVSVTVTVQPNEIERRIANIKVDVRGTELFQVSAEPITVVFHGPPEIVENVKKEDIVAFVDLGELGVAPGTYRREVKLGPIDSTVRIRSVPAAVIVEVRRANPIPQE